MSHIGETQTRGAPILSVGVRRIVSGIGLTLALMSPSMVKAATENPPWCKEGFICVSREEMKRDIEYHLELRERISQLSVKSRRLGVTAGCGFGVGAVVDSEWQANLSPAGFCGVMYGLRF